MLSVHQILSNENFAASLNFYPYPSYKCLTTSVIFSQGVEIVDTNTFITDENREKLENAKKTNSVEVSLFACV